MVVAAAAGVPCVIVGVAVSQWEGGSIVGGIGDEKGGQWWRWACYSVVRGATSAWRRGGRAAAGVLRHCWGDIIEVTLAGWRWQTAVAAGGKVAVGILRRCCGSGGAMPAHRRCWGRRGSVGVLRC